jgi:hypothetical protein
METGWYRTICWKRIRQMERRLLHHEEWDAIPSKTYRHVLWDLW